MPELILQRSCFLCGAVDDGPRHQIDIGHGRVAYAHVPSFDQCAVPGADPHPEVDESALASQLRAALTADPLSTTPGPEPIELPAVDSGDPANHTRDGDDVAPRTDPQPTDQEA